MSLVVYTHDFANFYEVSHAMSVQMSKYYNDIGKFTLVVPINEYNVEALKIDRILYDTERKTAYIIKNLKIDTKSNRITANGYTTNSILNNRVVYPSMGVSAVERDVYNVVNKNTRNHRSIPHFDIAPEKGLEETITLTTLDGCHVLDGIIPVLSVAELGHDMKWNYRDKMHVFEVYKGEDRTTGIHAVVFSDEQGTAHGLAIDEDTSNFANVAYIKSEYNGFPKICSVGTATGSDRHEKWFEFHHTAEEGETEANFTARVEQYGAIELGKLIKRQSFSVSVDHAELGVTYNIGDLVSCVSQRFGVKFNARISGWKYKKDINGETTEVILGEPKLTAIGEVKLNG